MGGRGSSPAGGAARAVWPASCRPSRSRGPNARGRKRSLARRQITVGGADEVAAVVAGKRPVSRSSHRVRVTPPLPPASARRGNGVRGHPNADEIEDRIHTPSPTLPTRGRERRRRGRRAIRTPSPALPARGRERLVRAQTSEEISRGGGGAGAADGVAGLALEDRRVKAEHRAPVARRRPADATGPAEFAGIEWSSEALA
jgi:hypothetical protein